MGTGAPGKAGSQAGFRRPRAVARRWLNLGCDLVFPPLCARCREPIESGGPAAMCAACRAALVVAQASCPRCAATLREAGGQTDCPQCRGARYHFDRVWRLGVYTGPLRDAVLRVKRPNERALAAALGDLLAETAGASLAGHKLDVAVPIPMHWTRNLWRGANSPDTIAERLARPLGLPVRGNLLVRRRRTAPQASLSHSRRRANVRGAFRARRERDLSGARVLLVDDIMTTGATANEAAKVLRKAGAAWVAVAVLARAEGLA